MSRLGAAAVLHLAAGTWLLIDLWRAWTPTLITIFGQAASTPPELIGGYALSCLLVPVALVAVARRARGERHVAAVALVVAASGITLAGIGSAFWGLLGGLALLAVLRLRDRVG